MASVDEIRDEESLCVWLQGRSREDSVLIAHRSAMRVSPLLWRGEAAAKMTDPVFDRIASESINLTVLRAMLTAGNPQVFGPPSLRARAAKIGSECVELSKSFDPIIHSIGYVCGEAVDAISGDGNYAAGNASEVVRTSAGLSASASSDEEDFWRQVREDAHLLKVGESMRGAALWSIREPDWFLDAEAEMRAIWKGDRPEIWAFWLHWWDGVVSGRQLPWDLQEQVALIPDEVWEQGPEAVAKAIRETEGDDASRENPEPTSLAHALERNRRAIVLQLDALLEFVSNEIDRLRGPNSYSRREHEEQQQRIEKLSKIIEAVTLMREAMDEEPSGSTALIVMDAQLPAVVKAADESVNLGGEPQVSEVIASMSITIKHLTDNGTPGNYATAIAFAELCLRKIAKWRKC
jgi:hypothetical protein